MTWTADQQAALSRLQWGVQTHRPENLRKQGYYDGTAPVKNLGIAVPQNLVGVAPVLGWPGTVVDVLAERLDFLGFASAEDEIAGKQLGEVSRLADLRLEFTKAVKDALIYGIGFLEVSAADASGSSMPVITAVDPFSASFEWDPTGKMVQCGVVTQVDRDGNRLRTLYEPNQTTSEYLDGGVVKVAPPVVHNRGVAGLVPIPNRMRSGKTYGHSEITPAVRYATDHGMRTMLGMEYNRELYTTPQRWMANVYPEDVGMDVENPQKRKERAWSAAMSNYVIAPPASEEESNSLVQPTIGQFASSPPTPYIEELRALTQIIAAESAIPVHYLGFITENPSSADAIRQAEARLVKKAELRQIELSQVMTRMVAPLLWHIVMGERIPDAVRDGLDVLWRDPATPTRAAMADAATKIVGAKVAPPRSSVIYDMLGFSQTDQRRLEADWARDASRSLVGDLADRAAAARESSTTVDTLAASMEQSDWSGDGS